MTLYQCFFFLIEVIGFGLLAWILYNFSMGSYQSVTIFIREFRGMRSEVGLEKASAFFIAGFINHISSFILFLVSLYIFPVAYFLFKDFFTQVIFGNMSLSQFIHQIPEIAAFVASSYSITSSALLHRFST
jgi:hypothetical protein